MTTPSRTDQHDEIVRRLERELETSWQPKLADELASRLASRGGVRSNARDYDAALEDLDRSIDYFERLVLREGHGELEFKLGLALVNRGISLCNRGDVRVGVDDLARAVEIYVELVERRGQSEHAQMLATARQNHESALRHLEQVARGARRDAPRNAGPLYDPTAVAPMRAELTRVGFRELLTVDDVDAALGRTEGTTLLVVNSVCGCAAGGARPGAALALQHRVIPDDLTTVFAGMEREAVARAREHLSGYAASSPLIALFRDGKVAVALERSDIEGASPDAIARRLAAAFDSHCTRPGPSIPPQDFARLENSPGCGSRVPRSGS